MRRYLPCLALTALLIANLVGCESLTPDITTPQTNSSAAVPAATPTQWLFVMQATDATLTQSSAGFVLVLNGTDPKTIQFADRPVRKANIISTNTFMTQWSTGAIFKTSQPNGAVVFEDQLDANGNANTVAVELKNPTGSGISWTFQLKDLEGKLSTNLKGRVSVFIDGTDCYFQSNGSWSLVCPPPPPPPCVVQPSNGICIEDGDRCGPNPWNCNNCCSCKNYQGAHNGSYACG